MNYLASYRGLKNCKFDTSILPLQLAERSTSFLQYVLPQHVSSLTSLCIRCENRRHHPGWESMEFNVETWPQPSAFLNLTQLAVVTPNSWRLNAANCQILIDYATGIPRLPSLNISWLDMGTRIRNLSLHMGDIANRVLVRKRRSLQSFEITVGSSIDDECTAGWAMGPGSPCALASGEKLVEKEEDSVRLSSFAYHQNGWDPSESSSDSDSD
ncbi:hypothetical protein AX16_011043 [Volvariella volvacea WC 439]|nr:hypothetical protein AX16_011043 [Volvariella volvacea WC 439]